MNWTTEYIDEKGYVLVEATGYFTEANAQSLLDDLIRQPYWQPGMNVLFDSRNRDYGNNGLEYMRQVSQNFLRLNEQIGDGKIALLISTKADPNLTREFKLLVDEELRADVRIYLNEMLAVNWVQKKIL